MTRLRGRAPKGERLIGKTPHGHWKLSTFIAALRYDRITAPMVIDRPMNGEIFLAYVLTFLLPTLSRGDIVVMDNLPAHKVAGVVEAIEGAGARILYLPPSTPTGTDPLLLTGIDPVSARRFVVSRRDRRYPPCLEQLFLCSIAGTIPPSRPGFRKTWRQPGGQ